MKKIFILALSIFIACAAEAQNTGIGTTAPHPSATLDVQSTAKGVLIPRMSTAQRLAISPAAKGLMVYDSTVNAFYYYNSGWSQVGDNLGNHTATQNINTAGHTISNNGSSNGISLDNGGNATVSGRITANSATITSVGNSYDYLIRNGSGNVDARKGFGATGINYIIALGGVYPSYSGSGGNYDYAFIGEIKLFAGINAPDGWALCNGQLLPISSNNALFSIMGTTYGGNGTTNFALPDLRGAVPVHPGTATAGYNWYLGQKAD